MSYITYCEDGEEINKYIKRAEMYNTCPCCNVTINPELILLNSAQKLFDFVGGKGKVEALYRCTNKKCNKLFIVEYYDWDELKIINVAPLNVVNIDFDKSINKLSPKFSDIYNEAHYAEKHGLEQICGMGYRKALEFLIKDYIIDKVDETEKESVKSKLLGRCINDYIEDTDIKELAKRTAWVGNDETHYVRQNEDLDLQDLKNLLELTKYYITMDLKKREYLAPKV